MRGRGLALAAAVLGAFGVAGTPDAAPQAVVAQAPSWGSQSPQGPPRDARFFGTYYGALQTQVTVDYQVCFVWCWSRSKTLDIDLRDVELSLDVVDHPGVSLVIGSGTATLNGSPVGMSLAGRITAPGQAHVRVVIEVPGETPEEPELYVRSGFLNLSSDGDRLTVPMAFDTVTLSKSGGTNRAPTVQIDQPTPLAVLSHGFGTLLAATASDPDQTLAFDQVAWSSDVDGFLGHGTTYYHAYPPLSPGTHRLTVEVIDDGGRVASDTVQVIVANQPPLAPWIQAPTGGTKLTQACPTLFLGGATDPEDGVLGGNALSWSSDRQGFLGVGASPQVALMKPGIHRITLTATDSVGQQASSFLDVTVSTAERGSAPQPLIVAPQPGGSATLIVPEGQPIPFQAAAVDCDSPLQSLRFDWSVGNLLPTGVSLLQPAGTGATVDLTFVTGQDPVTRMVVLRATDEAGLWNEVRMFVTVMPEGMY